MPRLYVLAVCVLVFPSLVRADPVAVDYRWSLVPERYNYWEGAGAEREVTDGVSYSSSEDGRSYTLHFPGNRIDFVLAEPGSASVLAGGPPTSVPFATVTFTGPVRMDPYYLDFVSNLSLTLTDGASGQSAVFPVSSLLGIVRDMEGRPLLDFAQSEWWAADYGTGSALLGDVRYQLDAMSYLDPNWLIEDGLTVAMNLSVAAVRVQIDDAPVIIPPDGDPPPQAAAPEPSSLLLSGFGLALTGLTWLRRRAHPTPPAACSAPGTRRR